MEYHFHRKDAITKGFGRRKNQSSYSEKEVEGELSVHLAQFFHMTHRSTKGQKQREANDGASGDRSGEPVVSADTAWDAMLLLLRVMIGTSNSLLKLWEKATISKFPAREQ